MRFGKNLAVIGKESKLGLAVSLRRRLRGANGLGLKFFDRLREEGEELDRLQAFFYTLGVRGYGAGGEGEGGGGSVQDGQDGSVLSDETSREGDLQMAGDVRSWLMNNGLASFIDPLENYGICGFRDLVKLTETEVRTCKLEMTCKEGIILMDKHFSKTDSQYNIPCFHDFRSVLNAFELLVVVSG